MVPGRWGQRDILKGEGAPCIRRVCAGLSLNTKLVGVPRWKAQQGLGILMDKSSDPLGQRGASERAACDHFHGPQLRYSATCPEKEDVFCTVN